jgi:hypothetical protein
MQKLATVENLVFADAVARLKTWRETPPSANEIIEFYKIPDNRIEEVYLRDFGL